jgi:hypothetical protein
MVHHTDAFHAPVCFSHLSFCLFLQRGVEDGTLVQIKHSYKVSPGAKAAAKKKKPAAKKAAPAKKKVR